MPADPLTVAMYLAALADRGAKISTMRRRLVAIASAHRDRGHDSPTAHRAVRAVLQGAARSCVRPVTQKSALTRSALPAVLLAAGDGLKGARDRAIVLLGFAAALRRSELSALDVADLRFEANGLILTIRRSKTDQLRHGREIGVPYVAIAGLCAATAVRNWLSCANITSGPVFRSFDPQCRPRENRLGGRDIARLVKRLANRAGLPGDFGAHSLRAGFVTSAAARGVPESAIQEVTGHRSVTVLRGYIRHATVLDRSPLRSVL